MIEAELKARVRDVEAVRRWLRERATEEPATYHDTYYDWPDHRLDTEGREIRLRTIETRTDTTHLLTYKQPPADASGSKPEHETVVADPNSVEVLLRDLGMVELVSLTKRCQNYRFTYCDRLILATIVNVPELDGTFLEIETLASEVDLESALGTVRTVATKLGVIDSLDYAKYTDSVMQMRVSEQAPKE
ncbi:class IV adenylate cyclase [Glycomyces xiaoerkulensis]|uniref:class IV adenylate cyclase n=1 Tax=Glycomyces xiaoerkulensis TaxID=2038139 RepID=UPI000C2665F9|nr:CYTH domain-containing protein [Glycomyces xiaoerkulensis]